MPTPLRVLRAKAQERNPAHFALTERQRVRQETILDVAKYLIADEGLENVTFTRLARALRMSPATLAFHFVDLPALLGHLIRLHLRALSVALGGVGADDPDRLCKRRAAYLAYTRTPLGGLTEAHLLLVRDRHTLPPDERDGIEHTRYGIGELLTEGLVEEAFALLDLPCLDAAHIEARLALPATRPVKPRPPTPIVHLPQFQPPDEKPGDWIFHCGFPLAATGPP
jgi:AcrR family transcriptional regulator